MVFAKDMGILQYMKKGAYLIDHTTSTPELAERIAAAATEMGVHSLDAPVSGGDIGAKSGKLVTMCGGEVIDVDHMREMLEIYSVNV